MQIVLNKATTITCSQPDPLFPIECVITYLDMKAHLCNSAGTWTAKQELLSKLITFTQNAERIILATDEDREGESIAWSLVQLLNLDSKKKPYERVTFVEITPTAIVEAIQHPICLNHNNVWFWW